MDRPYRRRGFLFSATGQTVSTAHANLIVEGRIAPRSRSMQARAGMQSECPSPVSLVERAPPLLMSPPTIAHPNSRSRVPISTVHIRVRNRLDRAHTACLDVADPPWLQRQWRPLVSGWLPFDSVASETGMPSAGRRFGGCMTGLPEVQLR
jgi:hypothetical protein